MIDKIKNAFFWATHTKLGWLLISFIWVGVFMAIDNNVEGDWAFWMAIPGLLYIVGLTLVMIAYAWVINTIREYKENKKLKEKNRL